MIAPATPAPASPPPAVSPFAAARLRAVPAAHEDLLPAALALAEQGFRVHPLRPRGKIPLVGEWPTRASDDPATVRELFGPHPGANVGIATGRGLLVLDADAKAGGPDALRTLIAQHGPIPRTVTATTGGGGGHLYLSVPPDARLRNSAGRLGSGLDIRTDGGQVVAPPSVHASGSRYAWAAGRAPGETSIAPAPQWLLDLLLVQDRPAAPLPPPPRPLASASTALARARAYLATIPGAVSGQGGHDQTFKAALALVRGFTLAPDDAYALLADEYNPRCDPPWSERELRHKITSATADGSVPWGYLLDAPPPVRTPSPSRPPPPTAPPSQRGGDDGGATPPPVQPSFPLTKSYASICQVLRTPDLRALVLGDGELEFNEQTLEPTIGRRPLSEADLAAIRERAELQFTHKDKGIQFSPENIQQAVLQVAGERGFHPVVEYLRGLRWDGVERLCDVGHYLLQIPEATGTSLIDRILRKWFISAVARALTPGCQVDTVLVLAGKQGDGKSSFFRVLAGAEGFSDSPISVDDKDAKLLLRRVWLLEWAELEAMNRASGADSVKAFITSVTDHVRPPYGKATQAFPRTCVIVGTTNDTGFLTDPTGNRRFWPVAVPGAINLDGLAEQRDQLWAEAVAAFDAGEQWWFSDPEDQAALAARLVDFERSDPWEEPILEYMRTVDAPTTFDVLTKAVQKPSHMVSRADEMRASAILRRAGFTKGRQRREGAAKWVWLQRGGE